MFRPPDPDRIAAATAHIRAAAARFGYDFKGNAYQVEHLLRTGPAAVHVLGLIRAISEGPTAEVAKAVEDMDKQVRFVGIVALGLADYARDEAAKAGVPLSGLLTRTIRAIEDVMGAGP
jgi:hypothetical protein